MTAPHIIRLGGHWQSVGEERSAARPLAEWLAGTDAGLLRLERRFGCPSGIEPGTRVMLVIEGVAGSAELNGDSLGALTADSPRQQFDVTQRLRTRNTLTIVVAADLKPRPRAENAADEERGPVWLEIDAGPATPGEAATQA